MTTQPDLLSLLPDGRDGETPLPTYVVKARYLEAATEAATAARQVAQRLRTADEPFDDVTVGSNQLDGRWPVTVRFVVVSVEPHTAAAGVAEALLAGGVPAGEVWAETRCA